jgi:hypothetical protein
MKAFGLEAILGLGGLNTAQTPSNDTIATEKKERELAGKETRYRTTPYWEFDRRKRAFWEFEGRKQTPKKPGTPRAA